MFLLTLVGLLLGFGLCSNMVGMAIVCTATLVLPPGWVVPPTTIVLPPSDHPNHWVAKPSMIVLPPTSHPWLSMEWDPTQGSQEVT